MACPARSAKYIRGNGQREGGGVVEHARDWEMAPHVEKLFLTTEFR